MSEVSDFSESIWIQSSHDFNQEDFMKILVAGAIAREEKSLPNDASYQVLVKAIKNKKSTAMKVQLDSTMYKYRVCHLFMDRLSSYWMCYCHNLKYNHRIVTCGILLNARVIQNHYTFWPLAEVHSLLMLLSNFWNIWKVISTIAAIKKIIQE